MPQYRQSISNQYSTKKHSRIGLSCDSLLSYYVKNRLCMRASYVEPLRAAVIHSCIFMRSHLFFAVVRMHTTNRPYTLVIWLTSRSIPCVLNDAVKLANVRSVCFERSQLLIILKQRCLVNSKIPVKGNMNDKMFMFRFKSTPIINCSENHIVVLIDVDLNFWESVKSIAHCLLSGTSVITPDFINVTNQVLSLIAAVKHIP